MKLKLLFTLLLFFACAAASYGQQSKNIEVQFGKGKTSRTYEDAVTRTVNTYYLRARRGQTLTVRISSPGNVARFHLGAIDRGNRNPDEVRFIKDGDLSSITWKVDTDDDIAIPVGAMRGGTGYTLTISITGAPASNALKESPAKTAPTSQSAKTEEWLFGGVLKNVKLDPVTKSAIVSGTTIDWRKKGTVYFNVSLRKGQKLLITADSKDIGIEAYMLEPLDGAKGRYLLEAFETNDYQIVARSETPGKKYTLTFKLQ